MTIKLPNKTIAEIFGVPCGKADEKAGAILLGEKFRVCPFTNTPCLKHNHDNTIVYGSCSMRGGASEDVIVCPNRLYEDNYKFLKDVALDAFGTDEVKLFPEYVQEALEGIKPDEQKIVAIGSGAGGEVKVGKTFSMDWILAKIQSGRLIEYVGIEVQSIDITGNYRDNWHSIIDIATAHNENREFSGPISSSGHGYNWANVHKRLIPQILRKGMLYYYSSYVNKGIYFVVPDVVFKKFEDVARGVASSNGSTKETINILTYALTDETEGETRKLKKVRKLHLNIFEFNKAFVAPDMRLIGDADTAIKKMLKVV